MTLPVPVTALYAGLLGIIFLALEFPVGLRRARTGAGDGDPPELTAAMRRHASFVERVPLALLLLALLELNGAGRGLLHVLGTALVLARLMHPFGLDIHVMHRPPRSLDVATTALVILVASAVLIWQAI